MGGMLVAIERGYVQNEIQHAAYEYQKAIERGDQVVVGVNKFTVGEETPIPTLRIDPEIEPAQIESLKRVRQERDQASVNERLSQIEAAARGTENLMPLIIAAVEAYATVGEIADSLRHVFGEFQETSV